MKKKTEPEIKPKKNRIFGKHKVISVTQYKYQRIDIEEPIIQKVGEIADEEGIKVYIVGGYVRDYYLQRPRTDFDFTVLGDALKFAKKVAKHFKTKAVVFEKFGTAMVPVEDFKLEFVGTRKEEYETGSRKPKVSVGTLEDDLKRRDFTVNSLAASINKDSFGNLIDLFHGKIDIDIKVLRTPLEPSTTYSDDPLRMLRGARFASQLDFTLDKPCLDAAQKMAERIDIVSQERITDEFIKIIASPKPSIGIALLQAMGLLERIFPELSKLFGVETITENDRIYNHKDIFIHSLQVLDNIALETDNVWLRFAALIHDIAKPLTKKFIPGTGWSFHGHEELGARRVEKIFRRMKLPLEQVDYVERLVRLHQRPMALVDEGITDSAVRRLAFNAGEALEDLFILCRCDITTNNPKLTKRYLNNYEIVKNKVIEVQNKDSLRNFQSPVRGEEIMEICGIEPSRLVGFIKNTIEEAILDGKISNTYEAAKEYFLENKEEWIASYETN